jgi:hypothetical protein
LPQRRARPESWISGRSPAFPPFAGMTRIRFGGSQPQPPLSPSSGTPRRTGKRVAARRRGSRRSDGQDGPARRPIGRGRGRSLSRSQLPIGAVIDDTIAVIKRRWGWLAGTIIAVWAPGLVLGLAQAADRVHDSLPPIAQAAVSWGFSVLGWGREALVAGVALSVLRGSPSLRGLPRTTSRRLPALLPYWLIVALPDLAEQVRFLLFPAPATPSVPNLLESAAVGGAEVAYDAALTVAVGPYVALVLAEAPVLSEALRRSWRLLSGNRWRITAIWIVYLVTSVAIGLTYALVPTFLIVEEHVSPRTFMMIISQATGFVSQVLDVIWLVAFAAVYVELRRLRPAFGSSDVAEVFA